jgi:hypothetical protein
VKSEKVSLMKVLPLLWGSPILIVVVLQGIGAFVLARICQVNLFQPILADKGFGLASFGVMTSVTSLFEALGSARPQWMRRWMTDLNSVFVLTGVMAVSLSLVAVSGSVGTVIWLCVFCLATGLSFPIQRQLLNDAIPDSKYRATVLSVESLVDRAVCSLVASVLGGYMAAGQLKYFLHLSAGLTIGLLLFLALVIARRRENLSFSMSQ